MITLWGTLGIAFFVAGIAFLVRWALTAKGTNQNQNRSNVTAQQAGTAEPRAPRPADYEKDNTGLRRLLLALAVACFVTSFLFLHQAGLLPI